MLRLATALVLGLAFALPASGATLSLASRYDVSGTNTDGSKYSGTATVDVISDATFYYPLGYCRIDLYRIWHAHE